MNPLSDSEQENEQFFEAMQRHCNHSIHHLQYQVSTHFPPLALLQHTLRTLERGLGPVRFGFDQHESEILYIGLVLSFYLTVWTQNEVSCRQRIFWKGSATEKAVRSRLLSVVEARGECRVCWLSAIGVEE
jgi:hypothetical protein